MSDAQERTEQATDKRMKEARSKGRLGKSTDLTAWVGVGAAAVMLPFTMQTRDARPPSTSCSPSRSVIESPDPAKAVAALGDGLGSIMATIGPLLVVGALAVVAARRRCRAASTSRSSRASTSSSTSSQGLGRVFGMRALWEGAKTLLKSGVVAVGLFLVVQGLMPVLLTAGAMPLERRCCPRRRAAPRASSRRPSAPASCSPGSTCSS